MTMPTTSDDDIAPFACSACGEQRIDYLALFDSRDLIADPELSDPDSFSCASCGAIEFIGEPVWREQPAGQRRIVHLSVLQSIEAQRTLVAPPK